VQGQMSAKSLVSPMSTKTVYGGKDLWNKYKL